MPDHRPDYTLRTAERLHLEFVLRHTRGDRHKAAEELDITHRRLEQLIAKHGLYRDYAADARWAESA